MTIQELYNIARQVEKETGIPALFTTAQAILEQGWNIIPIQDSNNIYGIKYHIPEWGYVDALTTEFEDGVEYKKVLKFQKYPTLKDCIKDHTELLTKYSYKKCLEKYKKDKNLKTYVQCVAKDYATDPKYAEKLLSIIEEVKKQVVEDDEFEEAKKLMVDLGVFKPYGTEYWLTHPTREELAVLFKRFLDVLTVSVVGEGKTKTYTIGGEN